MLSLVLSAGFLGLVALGCDRELSREVDVDVKRDGTVKKETEVVKERPDGAIVKEESEVKTTR
jgi:hypothetical protein